MASVCGLVRAAKSMGHPHTVAGRRPRHTIGGYPAVSLAEARKRAGEYLSAARDGLSAEMVDAKTRAQKMTVTEAHRDSCSCRCHSTNDHKEAKEGMLVDHIEPVIGARLIRLIRRDDFLGVVEAVTRKGHPVQANRVFSEIMALLKTLVRTEGLRGWGPLHSKTPISAA